VAPRDAIRVEGLEVSCVVGVNPDERDREQPLLVSVELGLSLELAGRSADLADTCNYARVADEIVALLQFRRYRLLEGAAEELAAMLLGVHPRAETVSVQLDKPEALRGRARSAGVSIARRQADYPRRWETARFGRVEVLLETAEAGLYLLHVESGKSITPHYHQRMRELEFRVRGELMRSGHLLRGLSPVHWSHGQVHEYVNVGTSVATLFCCDQPRFIPDDEVLVESLATG
jgi:FolB domain-containing protein